MQLDYFHQVRGNTIFVKYRETKRFHVPIPFMNAAYRTGVGGEIQGSGRLLLRSRRVESGYQCSQQHQPDWSVDNDFDIWDNIQQNLDRLLGIWEETIPVIAPAARRRGRPRNQQEDSADDRVRRKTIRRSTGKGYYTIDKPVGIITVNAPRPLVQQIEEYLDNLQEPAVQTNFH
ncbi:MAG: hypothetical protein U5J62_00195 [Desulfurivibrio sp.]|nr:hypothetical protein [Desulfurivibrio sp.]